MFDHSKECTILLVEYWSLMVVLATGSSRSPVWFLFWTLAKILCSALTSSASSRAQIARTSEWSKTISLLSKDPSLWLGLQNRISGLSMDCSGQ